MYDTNNIFAKIIRKELPCQLVYEDDFLMVFHDINPAAKIHLIAIPKEQFISFTDFVENAEQNLVHYFFKKIHAVARDQDFEKDGYRIISNIGSHALQTVKHFHVHILAGQSLGPLILGDSHHI